ncbi:MAG TPA: galactokinase, partial [Clostridiales bacterium]|nr:galactokinase [Clostridiales bacterium]
GSLSRLDFKVPTSPVIEKYSMIEGYTLVITNTGGDHAALTPHYAAIRSEMEEIAGYFGEKVLRDVPYVKYRDALPELMKKYSGRAVLRALHFYEENERVDEACAALSENDAQKFLKAVNDSGFSSLTRLQNCAVPAETDQRVILGIELSRRIIGNGAVRVHGGGFAGSILAVVKDDETENYVAEISRLFGKENVFKASVRKTGAEEVK